MQSDLESEVEQSEGGQEEGVYKILSKQDIEGIEDTFLVQLVEGGKRVRVSTSFLLSLTHDPTQCRTWKKRGGRNDHRSFPRAQGNLCPSLIESLTLPAPLFFDNRELVQN
jgi:hypothetical protein